MAKVISVLNSKGGSGKSTLATNLARGLQLEGRSVLIVDTDPQGTAQEWSDVGASSDGSAAGATARPAVIGATRAALTGHLSELGASFDVVVIDGAAKLQDVSVAALKASDLVLVPVRPSGADLWAVEDLVEIIQTRQEVTGGTPAAAFVVSQQVVGTNLAGEITGVLGRYGLPVLAGKTSQRIAYAEALTSGTTVLDMQPKGKAAAEIERITEEVLKLLDG